jgi:Tfp pilus assembly protein PilE
MAQKLLVFAIILLVAGCSPSTAPATTAPPADEKAAIAALGQVNQAQKDFFRRSRRYALEFDDLIAEHLLASQPAAQGYEIRMKPSADAVHYTITAVPAADAPGARHLFTDETGVIRAEQGKSATAASPPV